MSDNPSERPGESQKAQKGLSSEALAAIAAMTSALSVLSNREAREVITMVAASRQLRVTSMMAPIGATQGVARPPLDKGKGQAVASPAPPKKVSPPAPASWKQDKGWKDLSEARATIVAELKTCADDSLRQALVSRLRDTEALQKTLKQQLKGKGGGPS